MSRLDVGVGQFVLAGEPVAAMGPSDPAKAKAQGLVFYVEFRKDGQSIDPAPWWVRADNEKARG
jgi:murein hydrolase activator